jgi:hypothetical protein
MWAFLGVGGRDSLQMVLYTNKFFASNIQPYIFFSFFGQTQRLTQVRKLWASTCLAIAAPWRDAGSRSPQSSCGISPKNGIFGPDEGPGN